MNEKEIMVNVYCLVYNHEQFLRSALDGFVNQKTSFAYQVIVHDDASTDNSASIIREYEKRYPNIICGIYQTENQYSKKINILNTYIKPKVIGKYVAICEGDDYWCDELKLQKQFDYMETHSNCSACAHNTLEKYVERNKTRIMFSKKEHDITIDDFLRTTENQYHTSSLFYRSEYLLAEKPDFCYAVPRVGDYPMALYLLLQGNIHYFKEVMSVYRYGTKHSWSKRTANLRDRIAHYDGLIKMYQLADEYSNHLHSDAFSTLILLRELQVLAFQGKWRRIKDEKYKQAWNQLSRKNFLLYKLGAHFPVIFMIKWKLLGV